MASIPEKYNLETYNYYLPEELIAYYPLKERTHSKLMVIERNSQKIFFHEKFSEIENYLYKGDLLILNNTKVFPARLKGKKLTGGDVELLLFQKPFGLKFVTEALIKGKRIKKDTKIEISEDLKVKILEKMDGGKFLVELESKKKPLNQIVYIYGKAPLPPYIKREPEDFDLERYQTVYAEKEGSIAAPTAGLHFDKDLLKKLTSKGIILKYITLQIGYGTFAPIKVKDIRKHKIEPEYVEVENDVIEEIKKALLEKRRIIAVGTTVVRTLEFVKQKGLIPYKGFCDLYIYPGFQFQIVSAMITNFHLPKSSLLLLVCAFAGKDLIFKAYEEAIKRKYRFYSYGDATFII